MTKKFEFKKIYVIALMCIICVVSLLGGSIVTEAASLTKCTFVSVNGRIINDGKNIFLDVNSSCTPPTNYDSKSLLKFDLYVSLDGGKTYTKSNEYGFYGKEFMSDNYISSNRFTIPKSVKSGTKIYYYLTATYKRDGFTMSTVKSKVQYRTYKK